MTYLSLLDLSFNSISEETFKSGSLFKPADGQKSLPLLNLNLAYNNIKSISNTAFEYLDNLDQVNIIVRLVKQFWRNLGRGQTKKNNPDLWKSQ